MDKNAKNLKRKCEIEFKDLHKEFGKPKRVIKINEKKPQYSSSISNISSLSKIQMENDNTQTNSTIKFKNPFNIQNSNINQTKNVNFDRLKAFQEKLSSISITVKNKHNNIQQKNLTNRVLSTGNPLSKSSNISNSNFQNLNFNNNIKSMKKIDVNKANYEGVASKIFKKVENNIIPLDKILKENNQDFENMQITYEKSVTNFSKKSSKNSLENSYDSSNRIIDNQCNKMQEIINDYSKCRGDINKLKITLHEKRNSKQSKNKDIMNAEYIKNIIRATVENVENKIENNSSIEKRRSESLKASQIYIDNYNPFEIIENSISFKNLSDKKPKLSNNLLEEEEKIYHDLISEKNVKNISNDECIVNKNIDHYDENGNFQNIDNLKFFEGQNCDDVKNFNVMKLSFLSPEKNVNEVNKNLMENVIANSLMKYISNQQKSKNIKKNLTEIKEVFEKTDGKNSIKNSIIKGNDILVNFENGKVMNGVEKNPKKLNFQSSTNLRNFIELQNKKSSDSDFKAMDNSTITRNEDDSLFLLIENENRDITSRNINDSEYFEENNGKANNDKNCSINLCELEIANLNNSIEEIIFDSKSHSNRINLKNTKNERIEDEVKFQNKNPIKKNLITDLIEIDDVQNFKNNEINNEKEIKIKLGNKFSNDNFKIDSFNKINQENKNEETTLMDLQKEMYEIKNGINNFDYYCQIKTTNVGMDEIISHYIKKLKFYEDERSVNAEKMKFCNREIEDLKRKLNETQISMINFKEELIEKQYKFEVYETIYEQMKKELERNEYIRIKQHNYIQEIRGNIRIYVRVKPSLSNSNNSSDDIMNEMKSCVRYPARIFDKNPFITSIELINFKTDEISKISHSIGNITNLNNSFGSHNSNTISNINSMNIPNLTNIFNFDRVFPQSSSQEDVFDEIKPFIQSALDGENVCIFAYGATGSGKTYTMQGNLGFYENGINAENLDQNMAINFCGILPRTAEHVFEEFVNFKKFSPNQKILLSAIEIYNENIYDLFDKNPQRNSLAISISKPGNVTVKDLTWREIRTRFDIFNYTKEASDTRRTDSTIFNETSSRSHAVYQLKIEYTNSSQKEISSLINIIDLAGSEKCTIDTFSDKTKEQIENMKKIQTEAGFINKSLTSLTRVVNILADKKSSKLAIPYRDSKLTSILQNTLKPSSKTAIIVTISSDLNSFNSNKESLNFAVKSLLAN